MNTFEFIRKYKNPNAYRNRVVTYRGQRLRIAGTSGDGLILRAQIYVHPNDPALEYTGQDAYERIKQHISECNLRLEWKQDQVLLGGFDQQLAFETELAFKRGLEAALRHMNMLDGGSS